ncbi:MAG: S41 family peptidase [Dehalococcoidia bacterium]
MNRSGRPGLVRGSSLLAALLLAVAVIVGGCRTADSGPAAPEPAAAAATAEPESTPPAAPSLEPTPAPIVNVAPATPATSPAEATQLVTDAYRQITARLFREVVPSALLSAGWQAVREEARRQDTVSADQMSRHAEAGSADIDAFAREFLLYLRGPAVALEPNQLAQAAIRGMAAAVGDSHTRYLPPELAQLQERSDGTYDGIGVVTDAREDPTGLVVREVYGGSPADQAGVRAGDRIVRVNGVDVAGTPQAEVSGRIRGEPGTPVNLTLMDQSGDVRDVTVNRARIARPVIASRMLEEGIGYLRVSQFPRRSPGRDASADFENALLALQNAGARAFVLDLRGNPGGDPFTSVDIASNFVQNGPIFVAIDRDGRRQAYPANKSRTLVEAPLVVLIDGGSASGAEVVASALSEYGAAYLIGTTTCGCLSVGQSARLGDKSEIIVTVQQAVTGKLERSLEGVGLDPDEVVREPRSGEPDGQLSRAVEYLQARLS